MLRLDLVFVGNMIVFNIFGVIYRRTHTDTHSVLLSFIGYSIIFLNAAAVFQNEDKANDASDDDEEESDYDDEDSGTDNLNADRAGTQLQRSEHNGGINSSLPDTFQTNHLLFYERFKAYQDYILGKNKNSSMNGLV